MREPPKPRTEYKQTRAYAYAYLASQYLIFIVAFIGAWIAVRSLNRLNQSVGAAVDQANAAKTQADAVMLSQQPYVVVGSRSGEFAQFTHDYQNKLWIKLHVVNLGQTAALQFNINAWSKYSPPTQRPELHVETYWDETKRELVRFDEGVSIPPQSEYTFLVRGDCDQGQVKRLANTGEDFYIAGTIEWCDRIDKLHCTGFEATYSPDREVWLLSSGPACSVSEQSPKKRSSGDNEVLVPQPRCKDAAKQ
jgi:hypothetical protein